MRRALYSRTFQQAGRLQLQLRPVAVRTEPALVRSAVSIANIIPEYDSRISANCGSSSQRQSSAHRPGCNLLPWAVAATFLGQASCAGNDDGGLEDEVRCVRADGLLHTCWSPVLAVQKCTAMQVFSEIKVHPAHHARSQLPESSVLGTLLHHCSQLQLPESWTFTLSPVMARLRLQSVSQRRTPSQPGYGGMQLTWRV